MKKQAMSTREDLLDLLMVMARRHFGFHDVTRFIKRAIAGYR